MNRIILSAAMAAASCCAMAETPATEGQSHDLDEVVVTGSNHATSRNLLPYTVSIVGNADLDATGKTQLLSALSGEVPGLFVTERNIFGFGVSNGGSGGIKLRGVGGQPTSGILMMVDGQPQFAGLYSHPVADFYETEYVDHVEVLRGPGSVLYGSNAMGGVINVITKNVKEDGVRTTVKSQYGSYNTWQSSVTNATRFGKFSSLVSLGYDRTDGTEKDFDFKQYNGYAKVGYDFSDKWTGNLDYTLMQFIGNDPIYPRLKNAASTDIYHQNVVRGEAAMTLTNHYATTSGAVRMYYSYGNHYIDDPKHFHSLDDRFGILAYQNIRPWKGADATIGFDLNSYTGSIPTSGGNHYGENTQPARMQTMGHESITEYSPYVTFAQTLFDGLLSVNGGVRMSNSDRFGTHYIPQAGFAVRPGAGWSLRASLAKGYRNPSFKEMYLYKMANPELEPERMMNYEVSVGKSFDQFLTMEVTAFFSKGSNMIEELNSKNINTGSFINKGIEATATVRPCTNLVVKSSYSYLYTTLDNLTGAPKNQYFVGVTYQPVKVLTVNANLKGVGGLFVDPSVEHQNYALLGAKVTFHAMKWLDVFAVADNLTGAKYMINNGYHMPGTTAMGGVKLTF